METPYTVGSAVRVATEPTHLDEALGEETPQSWPPRTCPTCLQSLAAPSASPDALRSFLAASINKSRAISVVQLLV